MGLGACPCRVFFVVDGLRAHGDEFLKPDSWKLLCQFVLTLCSDAGSWDPNLGRTVRPADRQD